VAEAGNCLVFNPGSAVLPAEGARPSFVRMNAAGGALAGEIVHLD
jgi:predicted phosphodiesterase